MAASKIQTDQKEVVLKCTFTIAQFREIQLIGTGNRAKKLETVYKKIQKF